VGKRHDCRKRQRPAIHSTADCCTDVLYSTAGPSWQTVSYGYAPAPATAGKRARLLASLGSRRYPLHSLQSSIHVLCFQSAMGHGRGSPRRPVPSVAAVSQRPSASSSFQKTLLRNPNEGLYEQILNMSMNTTTSLYIESLPPSYGIEKRKRPKAQSYIMCLVCSSVVLMWMETGLPQLLAPLLLTWGKGADLVIRDNVVLNMLSVRSTSTLL
jgi:hypothetical protein